MVNSILLDSLSQGQRERIAHIDFTIMFKGEAVRSDLTERFGIAPAQATKDFTLYRELSNGNIEYDVKRKVHVRSQTFSALFDYDVIRTLSTISQGYGDGFTGHIKPALSCEAPFHLNKPSLNTVSKVSEAIHKQKAISIKYVSLSSGETTREIVPHTLVDNGLRWHVRAYDRKSSEFRDFVLTRIKYVKLISESSLVNAESILQDRQWNRFVKLQLEAHPKISHKEAIELDYEMVSGSMEVELRAATAGYLLRLWNVDCSKDKSLVGPEYHLALKNVEALYGVDNLSIAPGFIA